MPHRIVHYAVSLAFRNAPSIAAIVDVWDEGDERHSRPVSIEVAGADARAICVMVANPDWNGTGDGLIATGEIAFDLLESFVDVRMTSAVAEDASTIAGKFAAVEEAERRSRAAAVGLEETRKEREEQERARDMAASELAELEARKAAIGANTGKET